jgi:hypothetical protein
MVVATANGITITLANPALMDATTLVSIKAAPGVSGVVIHPYASETIDHNSTYPVPTGGAVQLATDGTNWWVMAVMPSLTNPMTTTGDMVVSGTNGVPGRLPIGAGAYVLTSTGSTPAWQKPPTNIIGVAGGSSPTFVPALWVITTDTVTLTPGNWLVFGELGLAVPASTSGYGQALVTTSVSSYAWTSSSGGIAAQMISPWDNYPSYAAASNKAFHVQGTIGVNANTPIYLALYGNYGGTAPTLSGGYNTYMHGLIAIYLGPF